jgi:L-histidine Nalpha-methyltransferase
LYFCIFCLAPARVREWILELFAKITDLEEYYPTMTEYCILEQNAQQIVKQICGAGTHPSETFNLVELGAGDGRKTKVLLRALIAAGVSFEYMPIDISRQAMELLFSSVRNEFANTAKLHGFVGDSVDTLDYIASNWPERRMVALFLGSSIGNYSREDALDFLSALHNSLKPGDMLLAGLDLKKDPEILRRAYADSHGVTRAFNLNLLARMRRELAATLDERDFDHLAFFNPVRGAMESYLISKKEQIVEIAGQTFHFDEAEPLHTELSHKYLLKEVDFMMKKAGFSLVHNYVDDKRWFVDTLVQVRH